MVEKIDVFALNVLPTVILDIVGVEVGMSWPLLEVIRM